MKSKISDNIIEEARAYNLVFRSVQRRGWPPPENDRRRAKEYPVDEAGNRFTFQYWLR